MDRFVRTKFKVTKRDIKVDVLRRVDASVPYCAVHPSGKILSFAEWLSARSYMYLTDDLDLLLCGSDVRRATEWRAELGVTWGAEKNEIRWLDDGKLMTFGSFLEMFRKFIERPYPERPVRKAAFINAHVYAKNLVDAMMVKLIGIFSEYEGYRLAYENLPPAPPPGDDPVPKPLFPSQKKASDLPPFVHENIKPEFGASRVMYGYLYGLAKDTIDTDEKIALANAMTTCTNSYKALWQEWDDARAEAEKLKKEVVENNADNESAYAYNVRMYEADVLDFHNLERQIADAVRRRMRPEVGVLSLPPPPSFSSAAPPPPSSYISAVTAALPSYISAVTSAAPLSSSSAVTSSSSGAVAPSPSSAPPLSSSSAVTSAAAAKVALPPSSSSSSDEETNYLAAAGTKPKEAGTKPKEAGTKPKEVGTKPKEAGTKPKEAGTTPKEAGTKPKEAGTTPKEAVAKAETKSTRQRTTLKNSRETANERMVADRDVQKIYVDHINDKKSMGNTSTTTTETTETIVAIVADLTGAEVAGTNVTGAEGGTDFDLKQTGGVELNEININDADI